MRCLATVAASLAIAAPSSIAHAGDASSETQPPAGLTNEDAIMAFGGAVMDCMQSVMGGQAIDNLRGSAAIPVQPATPGDRKWAPPQTPPTAPVWITDKLGYLMNITEPSPQRCEVHAIQLPVDRTFQAVVFALSKVLPDLKPVHVQSGFSPTVYQLEMVDGGTRYVVHMEGAEPGVPGHAFRFSLLYAWVQGEPADAH